MQVSYPPMPQPVTSFGGAILGDSLYVYGGHTGQAHQYSTSGQANTLWRLDLKGSKTWMEVCTGPRMQGLSLIGYRGKLYRLGGFTARNAEGDEHDLWSRDDVACCDPETGEWQALPSMPQPRSSFDAALLGDTIYVVGGWNLQGSEDDREWLDTACALDLASTERKWERLPKQPFRRRALSVAAYDGKLYVIGGIQDDGEIATRVDIYDPATGKWSQGPDILGESMDGFGSSAFAVGGVLYVSTLNGTLQRLRLDGSAWEIVQKLDPARFFHRMLPLGDDRLLVVGGANMSIGKFEQVEVIELGK